MLIGIGLLTNPDEGVREAWAVAAPALLAVFSLMLVWTAAVGWAPRATSARRWWAAGLEAVAEW